MDSKKISKTFESIIEKDRLLIDEAKKNLARFDKEGCFVAIYGSGARLTPAKEIDYQVFFSDGYTFSEEDYYLAGPEKGCSNCKLRNMSEIKKSYSISLKQVTRLIDFKFLLGDKKKFDEFINEMKQTILKDKSEQIILALINEREFYYSKQNKNDTKNGPGGKRDIDAIYFIESLLQDKRSDFSNMLQSMNNKKILSNSSTSKILEFYDQLNNQKEPSKKLRKEISAIYLKYIKQHTTRGKQNRGAILLSFTKGLNQSISTKTKPKELVSLAEKCLNSEIGFEEWCVLRNIARNTNISEELALKLARKFRQDVSMRHIRIELVRNKSVPNHIKEEILLNDPCKIAMQNALGSQANKTVVKK
ncbi:MAG: hypothetical protein WCW44_00965 [archaeon]|jgi:hypothetical protein